MPIPNELKKRAVVIGSGFGGLAAGIRLQAAGFKTTIVDRLDKPGGRAYVFSDKGFTFDAGPTVITAPDIFEELFQLGGKNIADYVSLREVDPMYRLTWEDGSYLDYCRDPDRLVAEIRRINPDDVDGYLRFYDYACDVYHEGYEKLCHVPFLNFSDMLRVSPQLIRLQAYRSVYSVVSDFIKDWRLRQAFSFSSLLIGGNPFRASSIYSLIHPLERKGGVWFPKGGTGALVQALVKLFADLGGTLKLNAEVSLITTSYGQVTGVIANDRKIPADFVVSNADVTTTYSRLLKNESAVKWRRRYLENAHYSMSLFVLYFGTNKQYKNIRHHTVSFCGRYQELIDDIFHKGVVADDFSLYLHAPSLADPSLAPTGGQSFYVLSPVPHLGKSKVADWQAFAPVYADRIINYLEKKLLPGLSQAIVTQRTFTPLDFKDRLAAHLGSAFSLEPRLTQSAWFRVHNADPNLKGLYFVGAGTHPGAGLPGVVGSAKATANLIYEKEYLEAGIYPEMDVSQIDAAPQRI